MTNLVTDLDCHTEIFHFSIYQQGSRGLIWDVQKSNEYHRICDFEIHFQDKRFHKLKYNFIHIGTYSRKQWNCLKMMHDKIIECESKFEPHGLPLRIEHRRNFLQETS